MNSLDKIRKIILPLGFEEIEETGKFKHKMFDGGLFDFSANDSDTFWVMHTIFKRAEEFGKQQKAEEIRKTIGVL